WIGTLGTADLSVGAAARALAEALARTEPRDDGAVGLVHGTLYARHILDVGEGPGVIDWHRFGQGPAELDAGMFLATLSRLRLLHPAHTGEALRAEQAFLAGPRCPLSRRFARWAWPRRSLGWASTTVRSSSRCGATRQGRAPRSRSGPETVTSHSSCTQKTPRPRRSCTRPWPRSAWWARGRSG